MLLKELATRTLEPPGGAAAAAAAAAPGGGPGGTGGPPGSGGGAGSGKTVLEWLLEVDAGTGFAAITTAVAGMCWRDEAAYRFAMLARTLVRRAAHAHVLGLVAAGGHVRARAGAAPERPRHGPAPQHPDLRRAHLQALALWQSNSTRIAFSRCAGRHGPS